MADPKAVLAEYDMPVPDGMNVKVVENADDCVHITMPAPPSDHMELSDEELSNAAGALEGFHLRIEVGVDHQASSRNWTAARSTSDS